MRNNYTLEERERLAYITGNTVEAELLAAVIDAEEGDGASYDSGYDAGYAAGQRDAAAAEGRD